MSRPPILAASNLGIRPAPGRLTEDDLARVAKQRDRHPPGGGAWQAWQRIYEHLETAELAQDAIDEQAAAEPDVEARALDVASVVYGRKG